MTVTVKVIGIAGVIGSGKSTLCRILSERHGFIWVDADQVVHELYRPGQAGYKRIREYFGEYFVGTAGVHRGRLRRFILKTPQKIWILNKLIHPLVFHKLNNKVVQLKRGRKKESKIFVCLEGTYFEKGDIGKSLYALFRIEAPDSVIRKRLKSRKVPLPELEALLKFQRRNLDKAGILLENTGSAKDLVKNFLEKLSEIEK